MSFPIEVLSIQEFPSLLREIPDPPITLNYRGDIGPLTKEGTKCLAVVGSRKYTNYGKQVVDSLISGLRGYPINIISGLALGIDSLAHRAALDAGLYTCAVPGSGIDDAVIYPRAHRSLALQILKSGGALLSEFEPTTVSAPWTFPQRNRIMAGLSHATLVIEAAPRSGTLITARLTCDYNRELLVVPGDIFRESSKGPHQFLKLGATPVTSSEDILDVFNIEHSEEKTSSHSNTLENLSESEQTIWNLLGEPIDRDTLIRQLNLEIQTANALLMQMEIKSLVISDGEVVRRKI